MSMLLPGIFFFQLRTRAVLAQALSRCTTREGATGDTTRTERNALQHITGSCQPLRVALSQLSEWTDKHDKLFQTIMLLTHSRPGNDPAGAEGRTKLSSTV